ncbi:thiamine-phosphate kinase [Lentisalinibacter sediminis]|uniref:thiamine-phosphate kinase n=1 Tax=Lentisalinibacter sediminis TaxID=2992237 RepID=UPI003870E678
MDEFQLIERYFRRPAPGGAGVEVGVGDDGAIVRLPPGRELVVVVDTLVAGVHFPADMVPADVGYRALAVNLSDVAAMGAEPAWMTLALTLPAPDADWLEGFATGLWDLAERHGVALIGGDTTRGPLTVSVEVLGHLPAGTRLLRGGARPDDRVFVSGTPGDAAAGLGLPLPADDAQRRLRSRFLRPEPRLGLGLALAGRASAAIDVSDGLLADLAHICEASGAGAVIDEERLPLSAALLEFAGRERAAGFALTGGDDYELCFTLPPDVDPDQLSADVAVTAIGVMTPEPGIRLRRQGRDVALPAGGYRHFGDEP